MTTAQENTAVGEVRGLARKFRRNQALDEEQIGRVGQIGRISPIGS